MTSATLLTPVSVTATGGGIDLDISAFTRKLRIHLTALNTAGTSPTLAPKLQHSVPLARGHEYSTQGTLQWNELREGASTNIEISAGITQSGARSIKRVALYLKKAGALAAGKKLTLKIETNTAGDPSGTLVLNGTSNTVDIDTEVSETAGWVQFTFVKPVDVADATVYHFVLSGDYDVSATVNVLVASNTVASGGNLNVSTDGTTYVGVVSTQSVLAYVDQYTFADVTSGAFTSLATAGTASVQTQEKNADDLNAIIRLYNTIGGTSNPAWAVGALVNGQLVQE